MAPALGVVIVGLGVMGSLYLRNARSAHGAWIGSVHIGHYRLRGWNLDGETNFPSAFSALLLLAACAAGLAVALAADRIPIPRWTVGAVALLLGFMSLDEVWQLHERLERRLGIDWQAIYLPIFAAAGVAGLILLRQLHDHPRARRLFLGGSASWAAAQIIEALQWDEHDQLRAPWSIVPEEVLEMTGSLLFLLAFLYLCRVAAEPRTRGMIRTSDR